MLETTLLSILLSATVNTMGFIAAKPIYEAISKSEIFSVDKHRIMSEYCEDMTEKAYEGEYHDFFMRDDKIENLTDILSLAAKSNPCIVGGRGVGKTALVEGLAYRIACGNAPEKIKNKKILKINVPKLIVCESESRGSALAVLDDVFKQLESDQVIMFIDDIGQMYKILGAHELIKTYLDSSDIKIIASATDEEYAGILKDYNFSQDYTYIFLDEPSKFDTFRILKHLKNDVEENQNVKIHDEVLMDIVNLTGRYMKNKRYPNKAVDILNLALVSAQKCADGEIQVTHQDVVEAIFKVVNMPIGDLSEDEAEVLETMNNRVKKLVIGQDSAVDGVCAAVKRGRLGLCDENKPRASFLFVGPSGVGKSELARVLGEEIGSFIDIDMLILGSNHSIESLRGSTKSKSELVEKITKNPYSVVLFDNIDSADNAEMSAIYEILDRGFLTDFSGNKVDFTNAIVVLAADLGDKLANSNDKDNKENALKKLLDENFSDKIRKNVIKKVTDIVYFNALSEKSYRAIIRAKIAKLESRLHGFGISAKISDEVIAYICSLCCGDKNAYGARTIDKLIRENIELPVSDLMMKRKLKSGGQVCCVLEDRKINFKVVNNA